MNVIKQNLTDVNYRYNGNASRIKYIVIHYTAGSRDYPGAAYDNTRYFKDVYRGASAHYFVDSGDTVWQCVEDKHIAWHVGDVNCNSYKAPYYGKCTNTNSIGVEMVSVFRNGQYFIKDETLRNTVLLVYYLMNKYKVPMDRVIRHYDVTGKSCPAPLVDDNEWEKYKNMISEVGSMSGFKDIKGHWAEEYIKKLADYGIVCGDEKGNFNPDKPVTRAECAKMISNALLILGK